MSALHEDNKETIYGKVNVLDSNQIRHYLYYVQCQSISITDQKTLQDASNIGKLDIVWRSNLGERGHLQTSPLMRIVINL